METRHAAVVAAAGVAFLGVALVLSRQGQAQAAPQPIPGPSPSPTPIPAPTPVPQPGPQPPAPGCASIQLIASGPGTVSGCGGRARNSSTTICPQPGEQCVYTAWPDSGAILDHWEGPDGARALENPVTLPAYATGFVRGVFTAAPGQPAQTGTPCPRGWGAIVVSDSGLDDRRFVVDACGHRHWIDSGFQALACFYNPFGATPCNVNELPEGPWISSLNCCPGTGDGQCRGC